MRSTMIRLSAGLLVCLLTACAQYENRRGVEVGWHPSVTAGMVRGQTSRQDVLDLLGPPSQVIALEDETVLYYLFEHSAGNGFILVAYNRFTIDTRYDRAIFFFDENDRLSDYATHTADDTGR